MAHSKESKYKIKVPKLGGGKKSYDFSLSLPGMISTVGAGVLALTFFFVMGILIGRGYRPEVDIPQLKPIMPSKEHGQIVKQEPPRVLTSEELGYPDRLKAPAESIMDQPVKPEEKKIKPKAKVKTIRTKTIKSEVFEPTPAKPGEPVYEYVYQVASFRKVEMAEALSKKLVSSGLRTAISAVDARGSTWYRVQVLYQGTPVSTGEMKAVLAKYNIGKPLLKKKTRVQ